MCKGKMNELEYVLGGGFCFFFIFAPLFGEMIQFDEHIFQMGCWNHQLDMFCLKCIPYWFAGYSSAPVAV